MVYIDFLLPEGSEHVGAHGWDHPCITYPLMAAFLCAASSFPLSTNLGQISQLILLSIAVLQVGSQELGTLCSKVALGTGLHHWEMGHPSHAVTKQVCK